jgi:glyoxylase-like metal-dependent hydrolase (beta-lactamase superfamily II)
MITYPHETPPASGAATEVADGIFWIRMPLPFKLDHINLWLLKDDDDAGAGWTIVDTGYSSDDTHALWQHHLEVTMKGLPVRRIIVTHYHPDHVGCAAWLHQKTGAPVWMTAAEFLSAHAAAGDFAGFDRENTATLFMRHGLAKVRPQFGAAQQTRAGAFKRGVPSVPSQYIRIMDGDAIPIGNRQWHVKTVFGHAPEHATLFSAGDAVLISGDQVLPRITTNVGVWGNQPEANPLKQFLDGMDHFESLPPESLVLPSHDRVFSGLHARVGELRDHHKHRLAELESALETPMCAAEVLNVLFNRPLDDHQLIFAIGEAIAHLHFLWRSERAVRTVADDGIFYFARAPGSA